MLIALVVVMPIGVAGAAPAFTGPTPARGCLFPPVIPFDVTSWPWPGSPGPPYALLLSLLPATATVIGVLVLAQLPRPEEVLGIALVVLGRVEANASGFVLARKES